MVNKNKHLCGCGSGKRMKSCCGRSAPNTGHLLSSDTKLKMRKKCEELIKEGKHLESCELLEQLAGASPNNPLIWNDLGIQYEASGQTDQAFRALTRGHECDPTYPPILYNLGKFTLDHFLDLRKSGRLSVAKGDQLLHQAIDFLNANLDRDPGNADAHYNLALAYAQNQDEQRSNAHMTVALRMTK